MPLIKIEKRDKRSGDAPDTPPAKKTAKTEQRARPERKPASSGPSNTSALVLGGLVGVALLAGVSIALIGSQIVKERRGGGQPAEGALVAPAEVPDADALAGVVALNPGPINGDYDRQHVVAFVNGEAYTMQQLEVATRIARTLAKLGGDPVPNYGDQEILGYQVRILKRQVDLVLMQQALQREGIVTPTDPVDQFILGFIERVGSNQTELGKQMIENSVTRPQLDAWFDASRATQIYIEQSIMAEQDPSERDMRVQGWLEQAWATGTIEIDFYDPNQVGVPVDGTGGLQDPAGGSSP